jgi:ParB-like chromosome segregation protein Spo0J
MAAAPKTASSRSLKVVDAKIGDLHEWERNPRTISKDALDRLMRSIEQVPEMLRARPIIARSDGTVIAGNMRLRAARELEWETIPTFYVPEGMTDEEAIEWAIRDNAPFGEWERDELSELLRELQDAGRDLDLTGLAETEVNKLLAEFAPPDEGDADEDEVAGFFGVLVECTSEVEQRELLERLTEDGYECRAFM